MNVILGVMEVVFDVLTARECLQNRAVAPAMETFLQTDLKRLVLNFTLKTCSSLIYLNEFQPKTVEIFYLHRETVKVNMPSSHVTKLLWIHWLFQRIVS